MQEIINQVFEMEIKAQRQDVRVFDRNFKRLAHEFETMGYHIKNPLGEAYKEQRTDIDATVIGTMDAKLYIEKVLKPIIYKKESSGPLLLQKGVSWSTTESLKYIHQALKFVVWIP